MSNAPPLTVHVLTHCVHPVFAYGSMLVWDSIRTGFPTARIEVVDNGSHADVVPRIRAAAEAVGAAFEARPLIHYSDHWHRNLFDRVWPEPKGPVVFLDPDVVLWENCEGWDFGDTLMAGHLMPEVPSRYRDTVQSGRLHPSFLVVPSIARLRAAVPSRSLSLMGPGVERTGPRAIAHDLLGPLYAAIKNRCHSFDSAELDCFTHIALGSHLPAIRGVGHHSVLMGAHRAAAQGDIASLRGLWRQLEDERAHPREARDVSHTPIIQQLRDWQGLEFDNAELAEVDYRLRARLQLSKPDR